MSSSAEQRLEDALERILIGKPERVKLTGKLTLNKINKEAGLGHSYIHKFPDFVAKTIPVIDKYNEKKRPLDDGEQNFKDAGLCYVEKIRGELNREIKLKEKYYKEKKDLNLKLKELEIQNNTLMYRVFELQNLVGSSVDDIRCLEDE